MEEDQVPNKDLSQTTDVKVVHRKTETKRFSEIWRDFDNLDLSLLPGEGEDLLADADPQYGSDSVSTGSAELPEPHDVSSRCEVNEVDGTSSAQEADLALCRCQDGVETALQYAKMWCRYAKDLLAWMEKRINLEQEFAKNVMKAAEGAKSNVTQQEMMPLQYIYTMALEQDIKNSLTSKKTSEILQNRCYQALAAKKNEIDKWRREFKEQWAREQRRMHEAVSASKKARQQYYQRCDELGKAKAVDDTAGIKTLDKRRKSKEEASSKVLEAETLYRQCLKDAQLHQEVLVKVKEKIISHIRKLICQGDTVLKEATVNMFYYQRQQTEPVPLGYHNLEVTCRSLEPGEPYLLYVLSKQRPEQMLQQFTFQEYVPHGKGKLKGGHPLSQMCDASPLADDRPCRRLSDGRKPLRCSDSESIGGSMESLSSPAHSNRRLPKSLSILTVSSDDLDERDVASESEFADCHPVKVPMVSRAALTHRFRKIKSKMIKCKQCENYIVVNAVECVECGMALHRKCMEVCQLECDSRPSSVFGVDLSVLLRDKPDHIPSLVLHCTSEIESRALSVQGVYRVSGSKPRVQKLCLAFEKEEVDLSDVSPHDITSVLKHFFKELPNPLLTFDLYAEFLEMGRSIQHLSEREPPSDTNELTDVIHNLQRLLQKLPPCCYSTLKYMMSHLHKVASNEENKMSLCNLGIVFGPTLLRPFVSTEMSMSALLETSYQAALVEFLIAHHDQLFGPPERAGTPPPPAPTAPLPDTPNRASCPEVGELYHEREASSRERPHSLESRTIKREASEGYMSDKSSSNEAVDQLSPEANQRAVLAVRASCDTQAEPVEEPDSVSVTQPQPRFARQPVKYYRHHYAGTRLSNPGEAARQNAAPAEGPRGAAGSSRGTSPERGVRRLSQSLDRYTGNICRQRQAAHVVEHKGGVPPRPRDTTDPTFPPAAAGTPSLTTRVTAGGHSDGQRTLPTSSQAGRHIRALCTSPKTHHVTSPAQKILSGLKLRRSHSGRDEQLFV